jgi:hypothetical protein
MIAEVILPKLAVSVNPHESAMKVPIEFTDRFTELNDVVGCNQRHFGIFAADNVDPRKGHNIHHNVEITICAANRDYIAFLVLCHYTHFFLTELVAASRTEEIA